MKKVGYILIIIGISIINFYNAYKYMQDKKEEIRVEEYIEVTSKEDNEEILKTEELTEEQPKTNSSIDYKAIIEIPSINLKRGIVDSTDNFKSINYSISADKNGNYPNEYGNFILYAHSGSGYIAFFNNLSKVNINDDIYIYFNGIKYHYIITSKYDIEKTGKAKINISTKDKYITLITCDQSNKKYQIVVSGKYVDESTY